MYVQRVRAFTHLGDFLFTPPKSPPALPPPTGDISLKKKKNSGKLKWLISISPASLSERGLFSGKV